jgi:hypothetical protein
MATTTPTVSLENIQETWRQNMIAPTSFATAADLRTKSASFLIGGEVVTILASNPKTYVWVPSDTGTDDGEAIIKPTDVDAASSGRWRKVANQVMQGSATYDPPSLADGAGTTTTVTVTGASLGDFAVASFSLDLQGIVATAYVSGANTVSVRFQNESGGVLDLSSGTLRVLVFKQ